MSKQDWPFIKYGRSNHLSDQNINRVISEFLRGNREGGTNNECVGVMIKEVSTGRGYITSIRGRLVVC